jgi:hypothetical protein
MQRAAVAHLFSILPTAFQDTKVGSEYTITRVVDNRRTGEYFRLTKP